MTERGPVPEISVVDRVFPLNTGVTTAEVDEFLTHEEQEATRTVRVFPTPNEVAFTPTEIRSDTQLYAGRTDTVETIPDRLAKSLGLLASRFKK